MKKIIGIGASVLDTIIEMDDYPLEDSKKKIDNVFSSGGGPVGNALVCISKLGVQSAYLGLLSNDNNGKRLAEEFDEYHVSTEHITYVDNTKAFTSYIVLNKKKGTRTCVFDRGSVPDDPSLLDLNVIKDYDILHLDGNFINIAISGAKKAKEFNKLVSLDAGTVYPRIKELLPYVDIFIASEDFVRTLTCENDVEKGLLIIKEMYNPKVLVATQGVLGGCYYEDGVVHHYDSFKVDCVDSNGAGDTFHGAFLVAYLDGMNLKDCCLFASATSAIKCQKAGVRIALPEKEKVLTFLSERIGK